MRGGDRRTNWLRRRPEADNQLTFVPQRLLVSGGRDYDDVEHIWTTLDREHGLYPLECLIHGDCPTGLDKHADAWGKARGIHILSEKAEWTRYGNRAGPIRNARLITRYHPTKALVFYGERGTRNMWDTLAIHKIHKVRVHPRMLICRGCGSEEKVKLEPLARVYPFDGYPGSPEDPNCPVPLCPFCVDTHRKKLRGPKIA